MSDPEFPATFETFALVDVSDGAVSSTASYKDDARHVSIRATVISGFTQYEVVVDSLQDVAYQVRAVCGNPKEFEAQVICLMVGTDHVLEVGAGAKIPLDEIVAFTEGIYELL